MQIFTEIKYHKVDEFLSVPIEVTELLVANQRTTALTYSHMPPSPLPVLFLLYKCHSHLLKEDWNSNALTVFEPLSIDHQLY